MGDFLDFLLAAMLVDAYHSKNNKDEGYIWSDIHDDYDDLEDDDLDEFNEYENEEYYDEF